MSSHVRQWYMGSRGIEHIKGVITTVINWVKQVGKHLPDAYGPDKIPEVGELDQLETFVGSKSGATPRQFPALGNAHQEKTKHGSGLPLTTFRKGSLLGQWETTVQKPSNLSGTLWGIGSVILTSLMA